MFIQNQHEEKSDIGHKRSVTYILNYIDKNSKELGKTGDQVWSEIKQVCVKTLISGLYQIQHFYKSAKPHDLENSFVFHILGIDIFLDKNLKIWLLEVNQSPSFMTDSPLDYCVKKNLICDSLHMLNLSQKRKNKYIREEKNDIERRLRG